MALNVFCGCHTVYNNIGRGNIKFNSQYLTISAAGELIHQNRQWPYLWSRVLELRLPQASICFVVWAEESPAGRDAGGEVEVIWGLEVVAVYQVVSKCFNNF